VLPLAFGVSAAKALFFLMTAFGAGKSDHGRFRRPSPFACMDGHGPRVTFWTCDQQLIRLHCTSSAIVCCEPIEAAEGQKFSAASRRAIEIVMVMNSQPTLHDSKPMLCRGILLLLNKKNIYGRNRLRRTSSVRCSGWFTFVHNEIGKPLLGSPYAFSKITA
jgi:hypothetical protein